MSVYLLFCQPSPVPIWGRTSRERIERILGDAVRPCTADQLAALSADDTVLLFRGDYLYDDRLVSHLAATANILLQLDAPPGLAVAAHVPAALAAEALALVDGAAADATLPGVERSTPNTVTLAFQKKLRKSEPLLERPYKAPLFPILPIIALGLAGLSLVAMIYYNTLLAAIFAGLFALSLAYFSLTGHHRDAAAGDELLEGSKA